MVRTRAHEYEAASQALRRRMHELVEAAGRIGRSAPHLIATGGALREAIDEGLGVMVQQCLRAADELDRVASVCSRRAMVCREYEAAWAAFERHHERWSTADPISRGRPPVPPAAPARWVRA